MFLSQVTEININYYLKALSLTSVSTHCFMSMGAPVMSSTLYWMLVMDLSVLLMIPTMVTYNTERELLPSS